MTLHRYADLISSGWTRRQVRQAVARGSLHRVAHGWYELGAVHDGSRLVRTGVRVGCLTALRDLGVWVPPTPHPHVVVGRWAAPPRGAACVHPADRGIPWPTQDRFGVHDAIAQVIAHHDAETALIVIESACNRRLITVSDARSLIARCRSTRKRRRLERFDPRAESGTETRVRFFLEGLGFRVRTQVAIPGVGRVDLLVGTSVIIECDSRAHHTGEESYRRDRTRDLAAGAGGYRVIRLTWEQVFVDWEQTQRLLLTVLRRRDYLRPAA